MIAEHFPFHPSITDLIVSKLDMDTRRALGVPPSKLTGERREELDGLLRRSPWTVRLAAPWKTFFLEMQTAISCHKTMKIVRRFTNRTSELHYCREYIIRERDHVTGSTTSTFSISYDDEWRPEQIYVS
jgi:hypothetical protein